MSDAIKEIVCPECGSEMILKNSIYGKFYGCSRFPECRVTHGAHQDTDFPLGIPADERTRKMRIKAHQYLDALWENGRINSIWPEYIPNVTNRQKAYKWLAKQLYLNEEECHIGTFGKAMCQRVVEVCSLAIWVDDIVKETKSEKSHKRN